MNSRSRLLSLKPTGMAVAAMLLVVGAVQGQEQSKIKATVIDRSGNRFELERFAFQARSELDYFVGDVRRIEPFANIEKILFQGRKGAEQQTVTLRMVSGGTESGTILTGGNTVPRQDSFGSVGTDISFTGISDLGPFTMRLNDVREVIFRHPERPVQIEGALKTTVIGADGKLFEVTDLRYLGKRKIEFIQRGVRRSVPMDRVAKIDLLVSNALEEQRPITIQLTSGTTLQGTVSISRVRFPGETDRNFRTRLGRAFTGKSQSGAFYIGLQDVKQLRFSREDPTLSEDEAASDK